MRIGNIGLSISSSNRARLGPELRGTAIAGLTGTATAASINTATGECTITRVDGSNQSFVRIPSLTIGRTYLLDIQVTGSFSVNARPTSGGTIYVSYLIGTRAANNITLAGQARIDLDVGGGNGTTTFTIHSIREVL